MLPLCRTRCFSATHRRTRAVADEGRVKGATAASRASEPLTRPSASAKSIAGATAGSASNELLHQSSHVRDAQKFAGPRHAHRLILLPIEVPGRRVYRDDKLGACRQRAFEKTVVGFVPDDTELGERLTDGEALDNVSDEFRVVTKNVCVLLEDRRTDPRLNQAGARKFEDERRRVVLGRESRELQNAGVKDDSQGRAWRVAAPARVAWLRRTQPPRLRSLSCRGFGGVLAPAPGTA